jgi:dCMP deaminase
MTDDRITRDQMLMGMAQVVARRSTCERSKVGVIVAVQSRPLVSGYNGAPAGMPHCNHRCNCMREKVMQDGRHVGWIHEEHCAAEMPCTVAVHAEANAIAYAAKHGIMLAESILYSTLEPCYECAKLIINAGIVRVVYSRAYRSHLGSMLLREAGVETCYLEA